MHGFDLTFAAPKSVSLLRALTDDIGDKAMAMAHQKGIDAAMAYLHEHAGYTRVHNPATREIRICSGCRVWWGSLISTRRRGAGIRTCTPTSSCPTGKPALTARWCRLTRSRCTTKPKPPG